MPGTIIDHAINAMGYVVAVLPVEHSTEHAPPGLFVWQEPPCCDLLGPCVAALRKGQTMRVFGDWLRVLALAAGRGDPLRARCSYVLRTRVH